MIDLLIKSLPLKERLLLPNISNAINSSTKDKEGKFIQNWKNHDIFKTNNAWKKRSSLYNPLSNVDSIFIKENQRNYKFNGSLKDKENFLLKIIGYAKNKRKWENYSQHIEKLNYGEDVDSGFGLMLIPIIAMYEAKVQQMVLKYFEKNSQLSPKRIGNVIVRDFNYQIKQMLSSSLVIELNRCKNEGLLPYNSSKDNFIFFIKVTNDPEWITYYFEQYPVLLHKVYNLYKNSTEVILEFLKRLNRDLSLINKEFNLNSANLIDIKFNLGDPHKKGRSVCVLFFENGKKVVYKPRNLYNEYHFHKLLSWIEFKQRNVKFYKYKIIDRGKYGWTEFLENAECESINEIEDYYYRHGSLLAVMYVMGASDIMYENIIAYKKYPCVIDLECVSRPRRPDAFMDSLSAAEEFLYQSVLSSGMLPRWSMGDNERPGFNTGSTSAVNGQELKNAIVWENQNSDEIIQKKKKISIIREDKHLPKFNGKRYSVKDYTKSFINGFKDTYKTILRNKKEVYDSMPFKWLEKSQVRILFRHTNVYSRIKRESNTPRYLTDALDTDMLFEYLWNSLDQITAPQVIQSEIDQLWQEDIPYFYTFGNSRSIWDGNDKEAEKTYFSKSAYNVHLEKLNGLSLEDLNKQVEIIEGSFKIFETFNKSNKIGTLFPKEINKRAKKVLDKDLLLNRSDEIAQYVLEKSFKNKRNISWIDLTVGEHGKWVQGVLPNSLYTGTDGIALYLAFLYKYTGKKIYKNISKQLINQSIEKIFDYEKKEQMHRLVLSGYGFPASTLYVMHNVKHILDIKDNEIKNFLNLIIRFSNNYYENDTHNDILAGIPGLIILLLNILNSNGTDNKKDIVILVNKLASQLIKNSFYNNECNGRYWKSKQYTGLGGFGHGTAGNAFVLGKLYKRVNGNYKPYALQALNYDNSLFDEDKKVWRDLLRPDEGVSAFWCHGASGIGLSRLLLTEDLTLDLSIHPTNYIFRVMDEGGRLLVKNR